MPKLSDIPEPRRSYLASLDCPEFESTPWVKSPDLKDARISIISSAGIHVQSDPDFEKKSADYRVIPGDVKGGDIVMSHISPNFDRTGFFQDINVTFPIDRLNELAEDGVVGSVGNNHYSFMGATDPRDMEQKARKLATLLKEDSVDAVILVPV